MTDLTASTVALCACRHSSRLHDSDGTCLMGDCVCVDLRPGERALVIEPDDGKAATPASARAAARPTAPTTLHRREPEIAVAGERPPSIEQILQAGKRSQIKGIVNLTERIAVMVVDLRGRLADEREAAEAKQAREAERTAAKAEVERLEHQLREAKAKLTNGRTPSTKKPAPAGDGVCPDCGRTGLSNLGAHRYRAHGYRRAG